MTYAESTGARHIDKAAKARSFFEAKESMFRESMWKLSSTSRAPLYVHCSGSRVEAGNFRPFPEYLLSSAPIACAMPILRTVCILELQPVKRDHGRKAARCPESTRRAKAVIVR